jgi:hypothetical protein
MSMDMRQQFEAWAKARGWSLDAWKSGEYVSPREQGLWEAWQAATKAEREACAAICDEAAGSEWVPKDAAKEIAYQIRARDTEQGG